MSETLDVKGLMCPLPVLKARKRLQGLSSGARLTVLATDPAAVIDFAHFCNEAGHRLLAQSQAGNVFTFEIEKG